MFSSDTAISLINTGYDGLDIVVTNCTLTVDGVHTFASLQLLNGGVLTHTGTANGLLNGFVVSGEAQILNGTNAATLIYSNVVTASIVVRDNSGLITYSNNADYAVGAGGNGQTTIQRVSGSSIPDGATVRVDYTASTSVPTSLNLAVSGDVRVAPGGAINVNARGYSGTSGSGKGGTTFTSPFSGGGGGHGGYGGASSSNAFGGNVYDSLTQPIDKGSGGGAGTGIGGAGGGAINVTAGGSITIDGSILANGANGTNSRSGGGAGGSILLSAGQNFSGAGTISANGAAGEPIHGGGGGGGRIALYAGTNQFTGSIVARGGAGANNGGAGTIYRVASNALPALVIVDNGGLSGTNTLVQVTGNPYLIVTGGAIAALSVQNLGNLVIGSNSWGVVPPFATSVALTVTNDATIDEGGGIQLDGLITAGGGGPGIGISQSGGIYYCGGGGHAGYGAVGGSSSARGGTTYGNTLTPTTTGSVGGGSGSSFQPFGGAGGGAVRLTVNGTLTLNGRISADGKAGSGTYAGGGSGGSVWLTLGTFTGSGSISANGGSGVSPGSGGGGGGRVSVSFTSNLFTGPFTAYGGVGVNTGGAGTVYLKTNSVSHGQVTLDNNGNVGTNTALISATSVDLVVKNGAIGQIPLSSWSIGNLLVKSNSALVATFSSSAQIITAIGNITVESGGVFSADGAGFIAASGTGLGMSSSTGIRGGAGHGGLGGGNPQNPPYVPYGAAYGSISSPQTAGSGGGNGSGTSAAPFGGAGGGAIHLTLSQPGILTVNGRLSANGKDGDANSGGGAGGSLWISATTLAGSGLISANGGAGTLSAGGAAGGRISIGFTSNLFAGTIISRGGAGQGGPGGAGTVYTKANAASVGQLVLDNGGLIGTNTPLSSTYSVPTVPFDLTISGGAIAQVLSPLPVLSNLTVGATGVLTTSASQTNFDLAVLRNVSVAPGGTISLDGKGYSRASGPGAGASLSSQGAGGGYGGSGGAAASGAVGGAVYGSGTQPLDPGSGGGAGSGPVSTGSEGGGAIRMSVGGTASINGRLGASGSAGMQDDSGGGSGGSVWIMAGTLTGSGQIEASGGSGEFFNGGGGGGGRIALYALTNSFTGSLTAAAGLGASPGIAGSVFNSASPATLAVISQSPTGVISNAVSVVDFAFNEPFNPLTTSSADVAIQSPAGPVSQGLAVTVLSPSTLRVSFAQQTTVGAYSIQLGPQIEDVFGRPMPQVYTGAFSVLLPMISGTVTNLNGQPAAGVLLQPSGGQSSGLTDMSGNYTLGVVSGWTGTVTPSLSGFMFVPGTLSYSTVTASVSNQNYLMVTTIAPTLTSGLQGTNLALNWLGLPGVSYQPEHSTNLVDWQSYGGSSLGTNGRLKLVAPVSTNPKEFFRINAAN